MNADDRSFLSITKYVTAVNKRLGPTFGVFVFLIGVYLLFAVGWGFGLIVIVGSVVLIVFTESQILKDRASEFEASCQQHNVIYKPNYSDAAREFFLGLSEDDARLFVQFRVSNYEIKERLIDLKQILNVELTINDLAVYKAGPIASLYAAAIGGMAFGGAGAIVGSLTTGQIGHGKIGSAILKLRANDIDEPLINIPFISKSVKSSTSETQARLAMAEKWTNLIEVMRFRIVEAVAKGAVEQ